MYFDCGVCALMSPVFALQKRVFSVDVAKFSQFLLDVHIRHDVHTEGFLR